MYGSEGFTTGPHIDEFCGEICLKLVDIDEELRHLKITIREKARHAAPEVRSRLEKVMKRIACNQSKGRCCQGAGGTLDQGQGEGCPEVSERRNHRRRNQKAKTGG